MPRSTDQNLSSSFPDDFLWGTSTAGHQIEGYNKNSDFWVLEQLDNSPFVESSGSAIEHLERYRNDIALIASLGAKAFRISLEWSRIEPEPGLFSRNALEHYANVLGHCHDCGMAPVVTLNHFTLPIWFAAKGGWLAPDAAETFARYVDATTRSLGHLIGMACTLNEPNIVVQQAVVANRQGKPSNNSHELLQRAAKAAGSDEFYSFFFVDGLQVRDTLLEAHRQARDVLKSGPGDFPVGLCLHLRDYQLVEDTPEAKAWRDAFVQEGHSAFFEVAKDDDFIGAQYYSRRLVGSRGIVEPPFGAKLTQMQEENYPYGLANVLREVATHADCPIFVTENGIATEIDADRITYIDSALKDVADALASGVDVRGYFHWSAFDNFEWMDGFRPKFGLIAIDRATQTRTLKPSAQHFQSIIASNGAAALK